METDYIKNLSDSELISVAEELQNETFSENSIVRKLAKKYFGNDAILQMLLVSTKLLPVITERFKLYSPHVLNKETKTILVCPNCKSDNVQVKMWVKANTNEIVDSASISGEEDDWCEDCQSGQTLSLVTLKPSAKVIGFQVIGKEGTNVEGQLHPNMGASFCIYNLSQARKILKKSYLKWRLLAIWEGDIEEPIFMFSGSLRE
jgi:hypothetical protein